MPSDTATTMLGREAELARIEALFAATRAGEGGTLLVRGEAGIGKTTLLAVARERATGLRVLVGRGVETERQLPFIALAGLLDEVIDGRDGLPPAQAAALAGALALGPTSGGDRLAVCVAALGLLRLAAEEKPIVAVIDDAHWLDAASAECIGFAAHRLGGTRVSLLLAARDSEGARAAFDDLPAIEPAPLARADAQSLVASSAPGILTSARDAVVDAAAGNPLALIEIASRLTQDERMGRSALPSLLRPAGRLGSVFVQRIADLPEPTREALLVAAAAGGGDTSILWRAFEAIGVDPHALDPAEAAGLVAIAGRSLAFAHPLVRSAAYHGMPAPSRRRAHRALADVVSAGHRAWHLADAALGTDEEAASAMQDAGVAAAARRGYAEAATAYERAAELTPDVNARARRLLRASNAHVVAGEMDRALARLDDAVALGTPIVRDPRVLYSRSLLLLGTGAFRDAFVAMREFAESPAFLGNPTIAAFLLADTTMAALIAGDCRAALELAERAASLLDDGADTRTKANVQAALCAARVFRGKAPAARASLEAVHELIDQLDPFDWRVGVRMHVLTIHACAALEDFERGRAIADAVLAKLDAAGAISARANPLSHTADAAYRLGAWDVAWQESAEAILLSEETRTDETLVRALATRVRLAAARGLEEDAREHAARALEIAERCGIGSIPPHVHQGLGLLDLGTGRVLAAIDRLAPWVDRLAHDHGLIHPTIIPMRPDLCEAYVMAGRREEAAAQATALASEAESVAGALGHSIAARCRGLVEPDFEPHFEEALSLETQRPAPFERARTLLTYGERLHHARRREHARRVLREAEDIFTRLGATPWCDRAAAALRAAGAVRRAKRPTSPDELTSQERRVATAIARGLTNREAGAELFLSPKTVDFHLRQVYGKLRIRSRAELAVVAVENGWVRAGERG